MTRQHAAYHINELLKLGLIKDIQAGSIVIYHITDFGRMVLQRIHSISIPQAKKSAQDSVSQPIAPPSAAKVSGYGRVTFRRIIVFIPLFMGLILLADSIINAFIYKTFSWIIGGTIIFIFFIVIQAIVIKWLQNYGR